jgi:hypothetical protein
VGAPADEQGDHGQHGQGECRLDEVREGPSGEHGPARHGQGAEAVDEALVHVVGDARAGSGGGEGDGLREDAGHQELAVDGGIGGAADIHGAAEDIAEQHHEHDRLDEPEDHHFRDPGHPDQVSLGDDQ